MTEETKVAEAPVTTDKAPEVSEPLIDNRRAAIENAVIAEGQNVPAAEISEEKVTTPEVKTEEVKEDPIQKIKDSVQKRIDKVIAKSKSVEEKLAEAEAELERLRSVKKDVPETTPTTKDDAPPTVDQIEAYIIKMREEGNAVEEIKATRYLIKVEKELAIKEVLETQTKTKQEEDKQKAKQLFDWTMLSKDYETSNPKDDMNLSNQNGELYQTALGYYNNQKMHSERYNNPNVIEGFRHAVADAYRDIHQDKMNQTPKGEVVERKGLRTMLADPSTDTVEETTPSSPSNSLSDAEKVREEIRNRNKNRFKR